MGGKSSKKTTVGYKYYWDIQSGLGRGPINELVSITADDRIVLATKANEIISSQSVYINQPNLFGGTDVGGEGGIQGTFEIAMGDADQVPTDNVTNLLTGGDRSKVIPGFRGMVTTFFSGLISAYASSPKPWKYRVRRTTKGWRDNAVWYPEKCVILLRDDSGVVNVQDSLINDNLRTIHAMNPAHILIECATNDDWGRGLSLYDDIDLDAFKAAADTLYNEKFGLCFRYNRQDRLDTFVQQILDHIGGVQYADLSTGKITLKLIRADYDTDSLTTFNYDNGILSVQDDDSTSADSATNEIIVKWNNPVLNEDGEARAQNLGSIQSVGLISRSIEYKALPTFELAARVAQRDLEVGIAGLTRLTLKFDRRAGVLSPASCFKVSLSDRGIDNMIMRVSDINENEDSSLTITAIEDVFGMPATVYSKNNQDSEWQPNDQTPIPVNNYALFELPYFISAESVTTSELNTFADELGMFGIVATSPTSSAINYQLQTRTGSTDFKTKSTGDWIPSIKLQTTIDKQVKTLTVTGDIAALEVGNAILVNDEIMRVDAVNLDKSTINVGRGCADSLPQNHAKSSIGWLLTGMIDSDFTEYVASETVDIKLLTQTSSMLLSQALAPTLKLTFDYRQARPYPPAFLRVDNVSSDTVKSSSVLSWRSRNRVLQHNNLVAYDEAQITKEDDVIYSLRFYKNDKFIDEVTTEDDSYTITQSDFDYVTLFSFNTKSELYSKQGYKLLLE